MVKRQKNVKIVEKKIKFSVKEKKTRTKKIEVDDSHITCSRCLSTKTCDQFVSDINGKTTKKCRDCRNKIKIEYERTKQKLELKKLEVDDSHITCSRCLSTKTCDQFISHINDEITKICRDCRDKEKIRKERRKQKLEKLEIPASHIICSHCLSAKKYDQFVLFISGKMAKLCIDCKKINYNKYQRKKLKIETSIKDCPDSHKICTVCGKSKLNEQFISDITDKIIKMCKDCRTKINLRNSKSREKIKNIIDEEEKISTALILESLRRKRKIDSSDEES